MSVMRSSHAESGDGGPGRGGSPPRMLFGEAMYHVPLTLDGRFPLLSRGANGAQIRCQPGLLPSESEMTILGTKAARW